MTISYFYHDARGGGEGVQVIMTLIGSGHPLTQPRLPEASNCSIDPSITE